MNDNITSYDTVRGNIPVAPLDAAINIADNIGRLLVLVNNSGSPAVSLPSDQADIPLGYFAQQGTEGTGLIEVGFLDRNQSVNLWLKGTCVPGDKLVLADPATAGDEGKITVGTSGFIIGIAEEAGEDGQAVRVRPLGINL